MVKNTLQRPYQSGKPLLDTTNYIHTYHLTSSRFNSSPERRISRSQNIVFLKHCIIGKRCVMTKRHQLSRRNVEGCQNALLARQHRLRYCRWPPVQEQPAKLQCFNASSRTILIHNSRSTSTNAFSKKTHTYSKSWGAILAVDKFKLDDISKRYLYTDTSEGVNHVAAHHPVQEPRVFGTRRKLIGSSSVLDTT